MEGRLPQLERKAIPKFASFPLKSLPSFRNEERDSSGKSSLREDPPSRTRRRRNLQDRQGSPSHQGAQTKSKRKNIGLAKLSDNALESGEYVTDSYVLDRVGDPQNLTFGTLHRYVTPSYFRFGGGEVVGSSRNLKINREILDEQSLVLTDMRLTSLNKYDRPVLRKSKMQKRRELKIRCAVVGSSDLDAAADFICLKSTPKKNGLLQEKERSNLVSSASSSGDDIYYSSVRTRPKFKDPPIDRDLLYGTEVSTSSHDEYSRSSGLPDPIKKKRVLLLKALNALPSNCDAWVDLINYQDNVVVQNRGLKQTKLTDAERLGIADVKLSMYEKALEVVKDPEGRGTLLLRMMEEATKVWDSQKVSSRWSNILHENPKDMRLWTGYLDFKQSCFISFRYEDVKSTYLDCLSLLKELRSTSTLSIAEHEMMYEIQLCIILRTTMFTRECGFSELAVAAWQALLEYSFFKPTEFRECMHAGSFPHSQDMISSFGEFWDSEVPRIGEDGARGWDSFCQNPGEPSESRTDTVDIIKDDKDPLGSWIFSERRLDLMSRWPARTIDDVQGNDPYRVVLFSDLSIFLVDSPSTKGQQMLLDAFLAFCQIPPYLSHGPDSCSRRWQKDAFLRNENLIFDGEAWLHGNFKYKDNAFTNNNARDGCSPQSMPRRSLFDFPMSDYQMSPDSLFADTESWFSTLTTWQNHYLKSGGPVETTWVINSIDRMVCADIGKDSLAELYLALGLRLFPKTVKKAAKSLLKKRPSSLRLYNAYALIEYRQSNACQGEKILITSINMSKQLNEDAQRDSIGLWRTWIWELISLGKTRESLQRLVSFTDEDIQISLPNTDASEDLMAAKPALILRTERALAATSDHMLSRDSRIHATFAMELLMIFHYLKRSCSLRAAKSSLESSLCLLDLRNPKWISSHEYLHQVFARLLHHHVTHTHLFKPSEIRLYLTDSIRRFRDNTIFLSLYAWNEARFRIDDRVRAIVNDVVFAASQEKEREYQESVISHFFAIHNELHRSTLSGSNESTIRSTFERAVASDNGGHSADLWKLYVSFEMSIGRNRRAKAVFYRGVKACPWAKGIYLLAFGELRSLMNEEELRGVYELMEEKEIRIHVGFKRMENRESSKAL